MININLSPPEVTTITLPPELFKRTKAGDRIDFDGRMAYEVVLMHGANGRVDLKRIDGKEPA